MKKKPELTEEYVGKNPFSASLVVKARKLKIHGGDNPQEIDLEYGEYVKVFSDPHLRLAKSSLKFREAQLWDWLMYTIGSGMDVVWVDVDRYKKECGIKDYKTYRQAVVRLAAAGWIAVCPKEKNVFFINPAMAFKGSRIKKYPENIQFIG